MRPETELVPYSPGRLDGSPLLVLAPHPDDEVFGCGGAVRQAALTGAEVRIVVLTDGSAQGEAASRQQESCEAARRLGVPEPTFWGLADRSLAPDSPDLAERLRRLLLDVRPRVVLVPSTAEVHPDHRAVALVTYRVLQEAAPGSELHRAVQGVRLAAYEVSAALLPNLLLDVSGEWEEVLAAAKAFTSQVGRLPYVEVLDAVASARRLTLPSSVRRAEAYHVVDLRFIRTHAASEWAAAQGPSLGLEEATGTVPLDLVVRTRNRPHLLRQALESVLTQLQPPAKLLVVNDGGVAVGDVCAPFAERLPLELVELPQPVGRSRAAQTGLERATASHVVFLDDDDLLLPEHLLTLGQAVSRGATVPYVDAVQVRWETGDDGALRRVGRHRTFGGAFDAARFSVVNHIPLLTVALPRQLAIEVGGFDPSLDLYEDWDLLLRLARRTPFVHVPRVTCEYRVIAGSGAITAERAPGSADQLASLAAIWSRHGTLAAPEGLAAGVMALVAERDRSAELARSLDEQLLEARGTIDGLRAELARRSGELESERREENNLSQRLAAARAETVAVEAARAAVEAARTELEAGFAERGQVIERLYAEIARQHDLLEQIHASRTWKLHRLLERLRGR